jgi:3D (Asp-Asp-Asp) domain-containing protein
MMPTINLRHLGALLALSLYSLGWFWTWDQERQRALRAEALAQSYRQSYLSLEAQQEARKTASQWVRRGLLRATVTAYTPYAESTGKYPGHPQFNRVAWRGYRGAPGTCAADTDFYPFGTVLRVEGLGFCVVADRGGAIRGPHRIDWYVAGPEALAVRLAREWGKREVWLEVLHER